MNLDCNQKKLLKFWLKENKILYNLVIKELNTHQNFSHLGTAKGTKEQQLQPNTEIVTQNKTERVIVIDPSIRNFATMFGGENAFQVTNAEDLTRLAKLQAYYAKLQ